MPLAAGARPGPYEILAPVGAGLVENLESWRRPTLRSRLLGRGQ